MEEPGGDIREADKSSTDDTYEQGAPEAAYINDGFGDEKTEEQRGVEESMQQKNTAEKKDAFAIDKDPVDSVLSEATREPEPSPKEEVSMSNDQSMVDAERNENSPVEKSNFNVCEADENGSVIKEANNINANSGQKGIQESLAISINDDDEFGDFGDFADSSDAAFASGEDAFAQPTQLQILPESTSRSDSSSSTSPSTTQPNQSSGQPQQSGNVSQESAAMANSADLFQWPGIASTDQPMLAVRQFLKDLLCKDENSHEWQSSLGWSNHLLSGSHHPSSSSSSSVVTHSDHAMTFWRKVSSVGFEVAMQSTWRGSKIEDLFLKSLNVKMRNIPVVAKTAGATDVDAENIAMSKSTSKADLWKPDISSIKPPTQEASVEYFGISNSSSSATVSQFSSSSLSSSASSTTSGSASAVHAGAQSAQGPLAHLSDRCRTLLSVMPDLAFMLSDSLMLPPPTVPIHAAATTVGGGGGRK